MTVAFYAREDSGPVPHRRVTWLLIPLTVLLLAVLIVFYVAFSSARVVGDSMEPNLNDGDRLLVTHGYEDPARGDIVAVRVPEDDGEDPALVIKRVVAIAGDEVQVEGDIAWVDGSADVPYEITAGDSPYSVAPFVVPADHVYVLGDNRLVSLDSRELGPIPLDWVKGRVVAVYLPLRSARRIDGSSVPD